MKVNMHSNLRCEVSYWTADPDLVALGVQNVAFPICIADAITVDDS